MGHCFVIQPFDDGEFDKRYDQVIAPAIESVGLVPYRVDRDPSTTVAIDMIHAKISSAKSVVADITEDNANVWYELGYAMAVGHAPVMLCSAARTTKFPFDVQHRIILRYRSEAPEDFDDLRQAIVDRLEAPPYQRIRVEPVERFDVRGLEQHELATIVSVAAEVEPLSFHQLKSALEDHGFNQLAARLATVTLGRAGLLESFDLRDDYNNEAYVGFGLTSSGMDWLLNNRELLQLRTDDEQAVRPARHAPAYNPDEEPF